MLRAAGAKGQEGRPSDCTSLRLAPVEEQSRRSHSSSAGPLLKQGRQQAAAGQGIARPPSALAHPSNLILRSPPPNSEAPADGGGFRSNGEERSVEGRRRDAAEEGGPRWEGCPLRERGNFLWWDNPGVLARENRPLLSSRITMTELIEFGWQSCDPFRDPLWSLCLLIRTTPAVIPKLVRFTFVCCDHSMHLSCQV